MPIAKQPTLKEILTETVRNNKLDLSKLPSRHREVFGDIMRCHTKDCGFTKETCCDCGHVTIHYGSCNNSACPACGASKNLEWAEKQRGRLLDAPYFHIIFTIPDKELNPMFLVDRGYMYNSILAASSEAVKCLAKNKKFLGAEVPGYFSVLHTWGSTLIYHVHVHMVFCAAGLDENGSLVKGKENYLFPVKSLAQVFKSKMLEKLASKFEYTGSPFIGKLIKARSADWNVEIREMGSDPYHAIYYLSRYINRIAITDRRLVSYKDGKVTFRYKNYKKGGKIEEITLDDIEFIRRYRNHILPKGFRKQRSYGFLANNASKKFEKMVELCGQAPGVENSSEDNQSQSPEDNCCHHHECENHDTSDEDPDGAEETNSKRKCPKCGSTKVEIEKEKGITRKRFLVKFMERMTVYWTGNRINETLAQQK